MSSFSSPHRYKNPIWYRATRFVQIILLYGILLSLSAFIVMPLLWMFTTALKPDLTPIFTIPPEFFPSKYWEWGNFVRALTNPGQPFLTSLICRVNNSFELELI